MKSAVLLLGAVVLTLSSVARAANADDVVWRAPLYTPLPSAESLKGQVATRDSSGTELLVLGTTWSLPYVGIFGSVASRVVALDRSDGSRRWQSELNDACGFPADELEPGAFHLTALPNGDIAVALVGRIEMLYGPNQLSACYARLGADDGRILWARTEVASSPDESFDVHSLKSFRNGDFAVAGTHAGHGRTLRLSGQDGRIRWSTESTWVRPSLVFPFDVMEVDPATDDVMLMSPAPSPDYSPLELKWLDGRTGEMVWNRPYCTNSHWTRGQLSPVEGRGVAFSFRCLDRSLGPDEFGFGVADVAGAGVHQIPLDTRVGSISLEHVPSGDLIIAGQFWLDEVETAVARFSAASGTVVWSVPGKIGGPDGTGNLSTLRVAADASSFFAWELIEPLAFPRYSSIRLTRFDAQSGQRIEQRDMPLAEREALSEETANLRLLVDGSLALSALSEFTSTGWLWVSRVGPDLESIWQRHEPVTAEQPSVTGPIRNFGGNSTLIVPAASGPSGVLVAVLAIDDSGPFEKTAGQPTVFRVARRDGRKLWEWHPDTAFPSIQGQIHSFVSDGETHAYLAGEFMIGVTGPFLARIDIADGHTLWQTPLRVLSLVQGGDDALYAADETSLYRLSATDGRVIWRTTTIDGGDWGNAPGLGVGPDGNPVIALPAGWSGPLRNVRVIKFNGQDGSVRWQADRSAALPFDATTALAVLADGDVVVSNPAMRLRSGDGAPVWQRADLFSSGRMVSTEGRVAFDRVAIGESGVVRLCLDASTGATLWSGGRSAANPRYADLPLAFDRAGSLVFVDTTDVDLRIRRTSPDGRPAEEIARIPALHLSGGYGEGVASRPADVTVGADGAVYVLADLPEEQNQAAIATVIRVSSPDASERAHDVRPLPPVLRQPRPLR